MGKFIEITKTIKGLPIPRVKGIALHSLTDPYKEAELLLKHHNIKEGDRVIVLGFGFGYHIEKLLEKKPEKITVIEPEREIVELARKERNIEDLLKKIEIISDDAEKIPLLHGKIFELPAEVKIFHNYFEKFKLHQNYLRNKELILKILVITPIYGGSLPIAYYLANALKKLGHNVEIFDNSIFKSIFDDIETKFEDSVLQRKAQNLFLNFCEEVIILKLDSFQPDLVLGVAQSPLGVKSLTACRRKGVPTAFWFVEDYKTMGYWREVAPLYDYFFTIQKDEFFEELESIGVKNYFYLPLAADPQIHKKLDLNEKEKEFYGSDISFVGAPYFNRVNVFRQLFSYNFKVWGEGWEEYPEFAKILGKRGRIEDKEYVKIYSTSKINLNLHSSKFYPVINPEGDYLNPRTFEIASCGAFQLVDERKYLREFFEEDEIVSFKTLSELKKKIDYYLKADVEREEIALKAREKVLKYHTYEERAKALLKFIFERERRFAVSEKYKVSELKEKIQDEEFRALLKHFKDDEFISFDDLVRMIDKNKDEFNVAEGVILLMDAIRRWAKGVKV